MRGSCGGGGVEFAAAPRTCVANCTSRPAYVSVLRVSLEGSSVASLMYDASVDRCVDKYLSACGVGGFGTLLSRREVVPMRMLVRVRVCFVAAP